MRRRILSGRFRGEQVDHLVWQARMTQSELATLLDELLGPGGEYEAAHAGVMEHLADRMRDLRTVLAELPAGAELKVLADEF